MTDSSVSAEVSYYTPRVIHNGVPQTRHIVLIAPSANAMRKMLHSCEQYAIEYNIMFNADKSKCIFFPTKGCAGRLHTRRSVFHINNSAVSLHASNGRFKILLLLLLS